MLIQKRAKYVTESSLLMKGGKNLEKDQITGRECESKKYEV